MRISSRYPSTWWARFIDGELVVSARGPAPSPRQAALVALDGSLAGPFDIGRVDQGAGWILDEPELRLSGNVLVPIWPVGAASACPSCPRRPVELAPDWVCEVISASTAIINRTRKLKPYARAAVSWLWLVDPATRTVEVLHLDGEDWMLAGNFGGDEKARMAPFDAVELEVGALWEPAAAPVTRAQEPGPADVVPPAEPR